jgi:hypothetical protein
VTLTLIDQYEVMYSTHNFPPRIWLKNGGKYFSQLVFVRDESNLPQDTAQSIYYRIGDLPTVIDLLRNEKPMYLLFSGSGSGFENGIKTTAEPVGEDEPSP